MVSKKVLQKIGVFAMAVTLAVAPVMAVSASEGALTKTTTEGTPDVGTPDVTPSPTPSTTPSTTQQSVYTPADNKAVVTDAGLKLVSTVPGVYFASVVDGIAVTTPKAELPAGLSLVAVNSARGKAAEVSINDGLAILAANGIAAVKGPEVDIMGYVNKVKAVDIDTPITIVMGVPAAFREAGYEYAILLIQEGGRVSILRDKEADPSIVSVDSDGFGVYVLVKAPAGSFDKFQ